MQTFRRRVLNVAHVEIQPPAVQEKAAVARRFLVVAVMQIDRPGVGFAEQIIFDLRRPKFGIHVRLVFAEKTTVLGFDSNDSIHSNQITRRMATWLSQKSSLCRRERIEILLSLSCTERKVTKATCRHTARRPSLHQNRAKKAQRAKHTSDPIFPAPGTLLSTALPSGSRYST